jgi:hypothetical protein
MMQLLPAAMQILRQELSEKAPLGVLIHNESSDKGMKYFRKEPVKGHSGKHFEALLAP